MTPQLDLFAPAPRLPPGMKITPDLLSPVDQDKLVAEIRTLPFRAFEFKQYVGKRRTVSFGWKYDFGKAELQKAADIPGFLIELRELAADFAEMAAPELQQVLVTEYGPGAGIGWHKDKAIFGEVIGISLLSSCVFRLRCRQGSGWDRASFVAAPGSAYLLRGPSRRDWEHSIPPVESLRYSVTFRNIKPIADRNRCQRAEA
jgi:alkylated DNA repair dioxygenase AlkB